MISSEQAKKLIRRCVSKLGTQKVPVERSLGYVLAKDIRSPLSLPVMDNSAMDGFVLSAKDTRKASLKQPVHLKIRGTIRAGNSAKNCLRAGEAYRIMTGAPIPQGADTVLPKERTRVHDQCLILEGVLKKGSHIRYQGEEVRKNDQVLKKNSVIHPGTIAVLTSLGLGKVTVFRRPRVSVIATGSELVRPGKRLHPGQIYDSNSWMISSALKIMGLEVVTRKTIGDQPQQIKKTVRNVLAKSDTVILMGGVSVGDYDYVKEILHQFGVRKVFWKVDQKPGKPLFFGTKRNKLIFGLPGNPASAYICFYEYVYAALQQMSGMPMPELPREKVVLREHVKGSARKVYFLKAKLEQNGRERTVAPLRYQGSHMVSSLHEANSLILMPSKPKRAPRGEKVTVDLLPHVRGTVL